jgi:electron transport complex protein RnfC
LVHYFNYAKGMLNAQERERSKLERVKKLAEAHTQRLEKAAAAKRAAKSAASTSPANKSAKKGEAATNDRANP